MIKLKRRVHTWLNWHLHWRWVKPANRNQSALKIAAYTDYCSPHPYEMP